MFYHRFSIVAFTVLGLAVLLSVQSPLAWAAGEPVAWWKFDEASGPTAFDSAGSYNGTLLGSAVFAPGLGISGGAIQLNHATNDMVSMGDVLGMTGTSFSLQAWIKTSLVAPNNSVIVGKHNTGTWNGYMNRLNRDGADYGLPGKASFYHSHNQTNTLVGTTTVTDDVWHQVTATYTLGEKTRLYVDGGLEATQNATTINANSVAFIVGGVVHSGTPANSFTGLVDDVQVYNYALSSDEVAYLHDHPGTTIPEPASLLLLTGGALGIARRRWHA